MAEPEKVVIVVHPDVLEQVPRRNSRRIVTLVVLALLTTATALVAAFVVFVAPASGAGRQTRRATSQRIS